MSRKSSPTPARRTFIAEWRRHRHLTQAQLAQRLDVSEATISRLENGKQPYSQPLLEALADALATDPASLLMRNPKDGDALWSIWDQAKPGERRQIEEIARVVVKNRAA